MVLLYVNSTFHQHFLSKTYLHYNHYTFHNPVTRKVKVSIVKNHSIFTIKVIFGPFQLKRPKNNWEFFQKLQFPIKHFSAQICSSRSITQVYLIKRFLDKFDFFCKFLKDLCLISLELHPFCMLINKFRERGQFYINVCFKKTWKTIYYYREFSPYANFITANFVTAVFQNYI